MATPPLLHDPAKAGQPQTHRNYSWRDYGNRVGIWRLFDLLDELQLPAGHCTNSLIYEHAPQITDAIRRRGDEVIAHGRSNAENLLRMTPCSVLLSKSNNSLAASV